MVPPGWGREAQGPPSTWEVSERARRTTGTHLTRTAAEKKAHKPAGGSNRQKKKPDGFLLVAVGLWEMR